MKTISIDQQYAERFVQQAELEALQPALQKAQHDLIEKTGKGNDFLGWVTLPSELDDAFLADIEATAKRLREKARLFIVIGIGGSYLGARAVIEALQNQFAALDANRKDPFVVYAGHQLSEDYMHELLAILDQTDYALTVISKSGTTTEPAVAFRILKNHLEKKYGKDEAKSRIVAITDKERGALKTLATKEGYKTYIVPDDVGGRYSVLTPVGLLPIAVAGFDIRALVKGAQDMKAIVTTGNTIDKNPAMLYAALRNVLYSQGKKVEIMVNYDPRLSFLTEWWKQLYGESEGKEGKGIFPAGVNNTSDLHSMGQYIQEGERMLFETVFSVENNRETIEIPTDAENLDGMNFVAGKRMGYVNSMAQLGTIMAHMDGGVPNIKISISEISAYTLGQLIYFYEFACGLSGYLLGVNPFDQPGVEAYKKNMFRLLGK
ncbi:MAG: glucose-6-phosphate isomerase [Bacteroidales bacterium]|jgi:glucose-6-phosphate isomerase|nr:glucose-6-phosphate isomerase [Bacteroidales bacterium]